MAAEDGLKAQKLLAQGVWMQNTLFFQGVLDVTYDTPPIFLYPSSLIFQSLIVRWVLSKLMPIFTSRFPSV